MKKEITQKDYDFINDYLNAYCTYYDDSTILKHIDGFYYLNHDILELLKGYHFERPKKEYSKSHLTTLEILDIVYKYLTLKAPEYKDKFTTALNNGTFELKYQKSIEKFKNRNYETYRDGHADININLEYNISDPVTIIHEFFHYLNEQYLPKIYTIERFQISEAISIYFESDMLNFLIQNGYPKEECDKIRYLRILDFKTAVNQCLQELPYFSSFLKGGPINEETWDFNNYIKNPSNTKTKEEFTQGIIAFKDRRLNQHNSLLQSASYVLGTCIAYYALNSKDQTMHQKMLNLNELLLDGKTFEELCKSINLKGNYFETEIPLINSLNMELYRLVPQSKEKGK